MNTIYVYLENNHIIIEVSCLLGKRILGSFSYPLCFRDVLSILTIYSTCRELFPDLIINYSLEVAMSEDSNMSCIRSNTIVYPMQEIYA